MERDRPAEKRAPLLFLLLTAVMALSGWGIHAAASHRKEGASMPETTLIVASDLHYLAPELTDHGSYFESMIEHSDGKVMEYIEELTDSFLAEVIARKPDALILSGDVSFNGARASHEALAGKLRRVTEAGIPVLVMPGNHDLDSEDAACFRGDGFTRVESVTAEDFAEIYRDFGFAQAIARDSASLSYVAAIHPSLRVLMLDVNTAENPNRVGEQTLAWIETQLRDASDAGAEVIAVSHQNLYRHNPVIYRGYVIENAEDLLDLYARYDVLLNLSGHLHCQHIVNAGLCEVATSSLAVNPCQYGVVTLRGGVLDYETAPVDVASRAAEHGSTNPDLLHFPEYAADFFRRSGRSPVAPDPADDGSLSRFFSELNLKYFAGRLDLVDADDPMFDRWTDAYGFEGQYILAIRDEAGLDSTRLTIRYE